MGHSDLRTTMGYMHLVREHLRHFVESRTVGAVFTGASAKRLSARQAQRRLAHWLQRAGIGLGATCHTLRHSFATRLYQQTGDLLLVKEALKHRSITSTILYARADHVRLRRVLG